MKLIKEDINNTETYITDITHNFENVRDVADKYASRLSNEKDVNMYAPLTHEAIDSVDEILLKVEDILAKLEKLI